MRNIPEEKHRSQKRVLTKTSSKQQSEIIQTKEKTSIEFKNINEFTKVQKSTKNSKIKKTKTNGKAEWKIEEPLKPFISVELVGTSLARLVKSSKTKTKSP